VALVLGGGGARGIAHVGVLRFLEEVGFTPHIICGSSIGAIIGARYAQVLSWRVVWEDVNRALESEAFKEASSEFSDETEGNPFQEFMRIVNRGIACTKAFASMSLVSEEAYMNALSQFIPQDTLIEETRVAFAAVAVDLVSGREVVITRGSILKAVAASASIPGIFPPVKWNGMLLADGGWIDVLPASAARILGADVVVGVWVGKKIDVMEPLNNTFDVVYRADDIARHYLNWIRRDECDVIIEPDVGTYLWNQFSAKDELFEKGYEAAASSWARIKGTLSKVRILRYFRRSPDRRGVFRPVVV